VNFYASSKITYGNICHSVRLEIGLLKAMISKHTVFRFEAQFKIVEKRGVSKRGQSCQTVRCQSQKILFFSCHYLHKIDSTGESIG